MESLFFHLSPILAPLKHHAVEGLSYNACNFTFVFVLQDLYVVKT
jgi:hypothetical protein